MPRWRLAALPLLLGPCTASWHPLRRAPQPLRAFDRSVLGNLRNGGEVANPRLSRSHMFVADIKVGTPPQMLSCLLDSGSADLWVPSKRCKDCDTQHYFRADKSETFMPAIVHTPHGDMPVPVEVDDSGGQIVGFIVQDRVSLGPWVFNNQSFLIVEESHLPSHRTWDGICGLGWKGMTSSVEPLYRNIPKHHGSAIFSLVPQGPGQTYLVVGEVPSPGHLAWAEAEPVGREGKRSFWVVSGSVGTDGRSDGWHMPGRFVIDTGTSFVLAPRRVYTRFLRELIPRHLFDHLCGADPAGDNLVVCDCAVMEGEVAERQLTIHLGGRGFSLPLPKLFKRVPTTDGGSLCLLHVQQNSMTSVNPLDLLNALLGNSLGVPGDSAKGGPVGGKGLPPGLLLPPFLLPQASGAKGPPLPMGSAEQVEEVTETRPNGQVCTTTLVWLHGHLKDNRTRCRSRRRLQKLQPASLPEDEMGEMWVLGGAFLEHFVTVLDFQNHRLGFGEPQGGAADPEVVLPRPRVPAQIVEQRPEPNVPRPLAQGRGERTPHVRDHGPPHPDESHQSSGGSWAGTLVFGSILLSCAGGVALLTRKMHTRKALSEPVRADGGEDGAELWEEHDSNAVAVAE